MTYHPFAIANYFIRKAQEKGAPLSPMKLQKLMYFAEGWNLAFRQEDLFNAEIEAWQYGPVIGSVYREFKPYGNSDITQLATTIDFSNGQFEVVSPDVAADDMYVHQLLDQIWGNYGRHTAIQLSAMTHESGTPWHDVYIVEGERGMRGLTISKQRIRQYFTSVLQRNQEAQKAATPHV